MKSDFVKNVGVILMIGFFGFVSFVYAGVQSGEQAEEGETNVYGWAWIGNTPAEGAEPVYGWLSLNCNNFIGGSFENHCGGGTTNYGLRVDPNTGNITGYLWHGFKQNGEQVGLGWIDFEPNPFPSEPNQIIQAGNRVGDRADVAGWFRNETLAKYASEDLGVDDWGWILAGGDAGSQLPWETYWDYSTQTPELRGWLWHGGGTVNGSYNAEPGLGWISLNCADVGVCGQSPYKVTYGSEISSGVYELLGYAWVGASAVGGTDGTGWVSFSCKNDEALPGGDPNFCTTVSDYQVTFNENTGRFGGYPYFSGSEVGGVDQGGGMWLNHISGAFPDYPHHSAKFFYKDTESDPDDPYDYDLDAGGQGYKAGQVAGWARIETLKNYGTNEYDRDDWGWVQLRGSWAQADESLGVSINFGEDDLGNTDQEQSGLITGWAWSGGGTDQAGTFHPDLGLGWIEFTPDGVVPESGKPRFQAPFIEASRGNIYGQKGVGADPGNPSRQSFAPLPGNYNATYLIESGGDIRHFVSEELNISEGSAPGFLLPGSELGDPVTFPQAGNRYTNLLGRLDIEGLRADVGGNKNKYGHNLFARTVNELSSIPNLQDRVLDDTIYVLTPEGGTFFADEDPQWNNAPKAKSGAGLMIVNGDLQIGSDMNYKIPGRSMKSIGALASVAWIVLGDITIDPSVTDLAGAYIALGRDDGTGGTVSTGEANTQLEVKGLLMAKRFNFKRTYIGTFDAPESSEKVIYDGRLHANVPPGLEDFSAGFPIQRATLP